MGSAVGLTTRLCTGVEATYGTSDLTSPRFLEFNSESLERKNEIMRSNALGSGSLNLRKGSRSVVAGRWGEGSIEMEVVTNGMGRIFRNLFGGTPTIAQQGGTPAWLQSHNLGSQLGKSLTIQKQLRDESDLVVASFTFEGSKFTSGEFKIDKKGKLMLTLTVDAEDVSTAIAAASPSLTATKVFHFRQGAIVVGGVAVARVSTASVKIDRKMDTDRFHLGNAGVKAEPVVNDFPEVTGALSAEFDSAATFYDRFAADSAASLNLGFVGDAIQAPYNEALNISIPEVRFTGETPKVGGPALVVSNIPFEGLWDGTNPGIGVTYTSTDTAL